ncbi:MAG TPA: hypothetical protein VGB52_07400 [Actinomycetota bacterium]
MILALVAASSALAPASASICGTRTLVLAAFPGEIDPLLAQTEVSLVDVIDGRAFYRGMLHGHDVVLTLTGIGLLNAEQATRAALDNYQCEFGAVVFSGVSGGRTAIGDVIVPARWTIDDGAIWVAADPSMLAVAEDVADEVALASTVPAGDPLCVGVDPTAVGIVDLGRTPQILIGGDGRSSDPFGGRRFPCFPGGGDVFGCSPCRAQTTAPPDPDGFVTGIVPFLDPGFIFGYFENPPTVGDYDAADMETAAVARVAADSGIPFIAFRALSDGSGDPLMLPGFPFQFFVYRQLAAENAAAVALAFLQRWSA